MGTRILVVGDAILDHYIYGDINRMSPEDANTPIVDVSEEEYRLGGCMNVAANIQSIAQKKNVEVTLASVYSLFTSDILKDKGIVCDNFCITNVSSFEPSKNELVKTRVVNNHHQKQVVRIDNRLQYKDEDIDHFRGSFAKIDLSSFDAVVVSDYCKGLVNNHTIRALENYDGMVFVDTKKPDLSIWNNIKNCIIKINEKEYRAAQNQKTEWSKKDLIVTCGKHGAVLWTYWGENTSSGLPWNLSTFKTESVENAEVTGAGDVFLAGFVVNYMQHKDLCFALEFANMCAGLSVKQQGTTEVYL